MLGLRAVVDPERTFRARAEGHIEDIGILCRRQRGHVRFARPKDRACVSASAIWEAYAGAPCDQAMLSSRTSPISSARRVLARSTRLLIVPTLVPRDSTASLALPNDEQQGLALLAGQLGERRMQILDREPVLLVWDGDHRCRMSSICVLHRAASYGGRRRTGCAGW